MTDIVEVRARLDYEVDLALLAEETWVSVKTDDLRALLADHTRLEAQNSEWAKALTRIPSAIAKERDALAARVAKLEEALRPLLKCYLDLANSGDCGFWNPEEEEEVIRARAALEQPHE